MLATVNMTYSPQKRKHILGIQFYVWTLLAQGSQTVIFARLEDDGIVVELVFEKNYGNQKVQR